MPNDLIEYDAGRIDLIKRTVAKGATQDEFELFLHACKRTGLDPLMKQIHAIKRWSAAEQRDTMAIQTGIDGYRLVADRTGKYAGSDDAIFEEKDGKPVKATVTVWKMVDGQRCPFTASARFDEYAQKKKDGTLTSFWARMSYGQLAKCSESLALRKAFPAELSGVYTHEEMMQAENQIQVTKPMLDIPQSRPKQNGTMVQPANYVLSEGTARAMEEYNKSDKDDAATEQVEKSVSASAPYTIPSGKWKGAKMEEVDENYLLWAVDNHPNAEFKQRCQVELEKRAKEQI